MDLLKLGCCNLSNFEKLEGLSELQDVFGSIECRIEDKSRKRPSWGCKELILTSIPPNNCSYVHTIC